MKDYIEVCAEYFKDLYDPTIDKLLEEYSLVVGGVAYDVCLHLLVFTLPDSEDDHYEVTYGVLDGDLDTVFIIAPKLRYDKGIVFYQCYRVENE